MEIKVLSSCCSSSLSPIEDILKEMGVTGTVERISDIQKIMAYGVMRVPAIVVNGKVKSMGRVPSKEEMKRFIREEMK